MTRRPGLTPEQLANRRRGVFASDVPSLFLDPEEANGRSAADVWAEKVYKTHPMPPTEAMEAGLRLEPVLIDYACEQLGIDAELDLERGAQHIKDTVGPHGPVLIGATLDAGPIEVDGRLAVIEAKQSGQIEEWGEPGTDQVPLRTVLQVQTQMLVTGAEVAFVPVVLTRWTAQFALYCVERSAKLEREIVGRCSWLWSHVEKRSRPGDLPVSERVLKRIDRREGEAEIPFEVVNEFAGLKDELAAKRKDLKDLERRVERAKEALLESLGDADRGRAVGAGGFEYAVEYRLTHRKPTPATSYRTLRVKLEDLEAAHA